VVDIAVALMAAKADVKYETSKIQPSEIAEAITDMGFPSEVIDDPSAGKGEVKLLVNTTKDELNLILIIFLRKIRQLFYVDLI